MCIHGDKSQPERDWVLTGEDKVAPSHSSVTSILQNDPLLQFHFVLLL